MDLSNLPQTLITQLTKAVEDYIGHSRDKYFPRAVELNRDQITVLQPFFPPEDLPRTRVLVLKGTRIQDPPFYSMARIMGVRNLPSFSDVAAVTFIDVIVSHEEFTPALLFHEMVHVVQYSELGISEFASRYVNGFIQGGSYEAIPLEKYACELEGRFTADGHRPFAVGDEVRRWIETGKF